MKTLKPLFTIIIALIISVNANAQTVRVAAAANLQSVIKVLQTDFQKRTGIKIEPIIGSSGKLVAQISNGAPYDVFLSADMEYPQKLFKNGFAMQAPQIYALGSLIICSTQNLDLKHWDKLIISDKVVKIAQANAAIAPYGRATEEALKRLDLLNEVKSKMVYGESIAQVNTYITTGVTTVGFTTQSLVKDPVSKTKLYWHPVDNKLYAPIQQGMVLITHKDAKNSKQTQQFYQYMLSTPAKNILKKYGYIMP